MVIKNKMSYHRIPTKVTSHPYRFISLSVKESRFLSKIRASLVVLSYRISICKDKSSQSCKHMCRVLTILLAKYRQLITTSKIPLRTKNMRERKTLDSFTDEQLWTEFRIRREDFPRLLAALRLNNNRIKIGKNSVFSGEEILLIARYRFVTGARLVHMKRVFLREYSQLSRAFTYFVNHILDNFAVLVTDNLEYWSVYFPIFSETIRNKLEEKAQIYYPHDEFRIFGFYDDTVVKTCRPGSGPDSLGNRKDNNIQRAFYNGWKKHHGHKFQTLEAPNGMCIDLFGPMSFRHSDLELLELSELNERLAELQVGNNKQYAAYGDGIFPILSHLVGNNF